jgi:hypothetical protein
MEDDGAGIGCHHKFSAFSVQHAMQNRSYSMYDSIMKERFTISHAV